MADKAHTIDEFHKFPWEKLDDRWFHGVGGLSIGGVTAGFDFNPSKPSICFYADDGSLDIDRWEIPRELFRLLEQYQERGREEVRRDLRNLLDVRKA